MTQQSWMIWVLLVGILWIYPFCVSVMRDESPNREQERTKKIRTCFTDNDFILVVADNFIGILQASKHLKHTGDACLVFVQKNATKQKETEDLDSRWPLVEKNEDSHQLSIAKWHINQQSLMYVLYGKHCSTTNLNFKDPTCEFDYSSTNDLQPSCQIRCLKPAECQSSSYIETSCSAKGIKDKYLINVTETELKCINCNNPVKKPKISIILDKTVENEEGEVDAARAVELINQVSIWVHNMNGSSAAVSEGEVATGVVVREVIPEDVHDVFCGYSPSNKDMNIVDDTENLAGFPRSVTISKEAFQKAVGANVTIPFVAVFRFVNMTKDEKNSTVLGNEVLAIDMGTIISHLTEKINISFTNVTYEGIPSCNSWNGEGNQPNWTGDGCETIQTGDGITCQCSHLTFFAILLTPLNETISVTDLNNLTIITQVGCGLSMFFLCIILFMHFLIRKTKANTSSRILIHLVVAMFFLNFTFLINNFVAKMQNPMGCKILAALMHYFMLATFTWFSVQAFHLCLQLYKGGKIEVSLYLLKVSVTSWLLPSIIVIVLISIGKYGVQTIHPGNAENSVAMCWITDDNVHYIVNIGYYAMVFLFTFTTFVIILSWLFCLKGTKAEGAQVNRNGRSIVTVLGLCCMLGITWGFAFFAYGVLRFAAYYIFTILNSFQGFFLFIYYYKTRHSGEINTSSSSSSSTSIATLKTNLENENPYANKTI